MAGRITRRHFVTGAGLLVGSALLQRGAPAARKRQQRVRLGIIGAAGQGEYNWSNLASEEIVALCDVDLGRVGRAAQRFPAAQVVQDFRRVLDRQDVDAVVISTPDHWHGIIAVWALEAGKHIYCEKPLARTIHEVRVVTETARRQKRVTQMGTQIHAGSNYRRVVELIRAGAIGEVSRVDVCCEKQPLRGRRARDGSPPAALDYDLWIGPAPMRPFDPAVVPYHWRWWWDFGGGVLADMGCHFMDLPHWALDLRHPERVCADGSEFSDADNKVPVEMRADFHYPPRGNHPAVHLVWWHGTAGPKDESGRLLNLGYRSGVLFHGSEGQLVADYSSHRLFPEEKFRDYRRPEPSIPESVGHHREWADAIRGSGSPSCSFEYSGPLTEAVLLGNVAYRLDLEAKWDPERLRVRGCPQAEQYIYPDFRGRWRLKP